MEEFINLTNENIEEETLCCLVRSHKTNPGVEAKRNWLKERLKEGHIYRKLNKKATVFIEYAPLEYAWVPIIGENYYYIYCLWVDGEYKGKGYGKKLMDYCIADAKKNNKSGVCMLGAKKQKHWLSNQDFAKKFGFKVVDENDRYELLALSFDDTIPEFTKNAKTMTIDSKDLTIYYDMQCPYSYQMIEGIKNYCSINNIPLSLIKVDTLKQAKELPCVFNNWAVFYNGKFITVNLLDIASLEKIIKD